MILKVVSLVLAAFLVWYLYTTVIVPLNQALVYNRALTDAHPINMEKASAIFFRPYNLLQADLREQFVGQLLGNKAAEDKGFRRVTEEAAKALEEVNKKDPYEVQPLLLLARIYTVQAEKNTERKAELLEKAEARLRHAIVLNPRRQELYYRLASFLISLDRFEEAEEISKQAIALEPRVYMAYYNYAIVMGTKAYKTGAEEDKEKVERALDRALELARKGPHTSLTLDDFENIKKLYMVAGAYRKAQRALMRGIVYYYNLKDLYISGIALGRAHRDKEGVIWFARGLKFIFPQFTKEADMIIELAAKERWEELTIP